MQPAIHQAVDYLTTLATAPPASDTLVEALLQAEKAAKQTKTRHRYEQLLGTWRLGFITGTKKSRQSAGIVLGAGRFLPRWVKICLTYQQDSEPERGTVQNSVNLGPLDITLSGPTRFWPKLNILSFDFTRMRLTLGSLKLYDGPIRKGQQREAAFSEQNLKQQAFFNYFLVEKDCIAARGRGGGLALWTRTN